MERIDGKLSNSWIKGKRIHIAGSCSATLDHNLLKYIHEFVFCTVKQVLLNGGGIVSTLGDDPLSDTTSDYSIILDWTVLESSQNSTKSNTVLWENENNPAIIVVGLPKWREKIPEHRLSLWDELSENKFLKLVQVRSELGVGGILREKQSEFGDILLTIGGGPGVNHLADLYLNMKKPVIPLDIPAKGEGKSASELLFNKVMEHPDLFFTCKSGGDITRLFSRLSYKNDLSVDEYVKRLFNFIEELAMPKAFYIRLMNDEINDYIEVEKYFRNVVDKVVIKYGYIRFESGLDDSKEIFLNEEIFKNLHYSHFVIVDITALRPNCFLEFGYALGQKKKFVLMAKNGTILPFDTKMISCHFWNVEEDDEKRIEKLVKFIDKNIIRNPIIDEY